MKITVMDGHAANPGDMDWSIFEEFGEITVYDRTPEELVVERAKDSDAVFTNKVVFSREVMEQLPKLRYIGVLATGTNAVDIEAAHELGVTVTNIPAYSTDSVAQMTFAHILNTVNRVDDYVRGVRSGRWTNSPYFCYWDGTVHELASLTIGIVGLGNIGMKVAEIAHAFGMNIMAQTSKLVHQLPDYIKKSTLEGILTKADIVSLHCPLTPTTHHIINAEALAMMKPSAILVNTGRGPLVDEMAVAEALNTDRLGAYCADVMEQEPPAADNPLVSCEKAFLTPHQAWAPVEARRRLFALQHQNLQAYVSGKPINLV